MPLSTAAEAASSGRAKTARRWPESPKSPRSAPRFAVDVDAASDPKTSAKRRATRAKVRGFRDTVPCQFRFGWLVRQRPGEGRDSGFSGFFWRGGDGADPSPFARDG